MWRTDCAQTLCADVCTQSPFPPVRWRRFHNEPILYCFPLQHPTAGNKERVYTLGSKGRDFLADAFGVPVDWYFRPEKVRHMSYGHVIHNLTLTRFLVAS